MKCLIASVALTLSLEYCVWAYFSPQVDLRKVCTEAEVIVVGRVEAAESTDQVYRRAGSQFDGKFALWRATLAIDQWIKGQSDGKTIVIEFPGPARVNSGDPVVLLVQSERLKPGQLVAAFLRPNAKHAGTYVFVNENRSAVHLADSATVARLVHGPTPSPNPETQVVALLAASLIDTPKETIEQSLNDLINLEGKDAWPAIHVLSEHAKSDAVRGQALAALIREGDYSQLPEAVEYLCSANESDRFVKTAKIHLSTRLASVKDAHLIGRYYAPLYDHPNDSVRRNAYYALREARIPTSAPLLIRGLTDIDQQTRYHCIQGLVGITRQPRSAEWSPSSEAFRKNENEYIARWKNWWETQGRAEFDKSTNAVNGATTPTSSKPIRRNSIAEMVESNDFI